MGKFEDGCYGSLKGIALIAKVLAGRGKMHYTRVAAGKGMIPEGMTPKTMEEPPEYVMDAMISAITNPLDGECQVTVQLNSANVEAGFYVTSLLLYAEDPDEGEVPFTYLVLEGEPEWIRPSSSIVGKLATFDIIAAVGDVDTVTATIDQNSLATAEAVARMIGEHNTDFTAHADIRWALEHLVARVDVTIPANGWITEEAGQYRLRRDVSVSGVTAEMIPHLTIPVEREETAAGCGLSSVVETVEGGVRLRSVIAPAADITASLVLLQSGTEVAQLPQGSGAIAAVPFATEDTPGIVMVGDGLKVDKKTGRVSVNMATDKDFEQMMAGLDGGGGA